MLKPLHKFSREMYTLPWKLDLMSLHYVFFINPPEFVVSVTLPVWTLRVQAAAWRVTFFVTKEYTKTWALFQVRKWLVFTENHVEQGNDSPPKHGWDNCLPGCTLKPVLRQPLVSNWALKQKSHPRGQMTTWSVLVRMNFPGIKLLRIVYCTHKGHNVLNPLLTPMSNTSQITCTSTL